MTQIAQRESPEHDASAHRLGRGKVPVVTPVNALWNHVATTPDGSRSSRPGFAHPIVQPKLEVGAPDDQYEREADHVADMVMRMPDPAPAVSTASPGRLATRRVQRLCSECEDELESGPADELIQPKPGGGGTPSQAPAATQAGISAMRGGGWPLPPAARRTFEPRFGSDFSGVRIHADSRASGLAKSLSARAFTVGNDIAFAAGQYHPGTQSGDRLLAHELTHVVQQGAADRPFVQRNGEPGTSVYKDQVSSTSTNIKEPGVWEGEVDRREYRSASDKKLKKAPILSSRVGLRFDANSCEVTIPYKVAFAHPSAANWPVCGADAGSAPPAHLGPDDYQDLSEQFVSVANDRLNGWYAARIESCEHDCAGRDIPIRVVVSVDQADPDATVILANKRGRSCVSGAQIVIHASGASSHRIAHEAGHAILGHGDEYEERGYPIERVRMGDYSLMAEADLFGRWSLLHERHFAFVPTFLNSILPGDCSASLEELRGPVTLDFRLRASGGFASYEGGNGTYVELGFDLGIPIDRLREWEFLIGLRGRTLGRFEGDVRAAWLAGLRVGSEHTFSGSADSFRVGAFGEVGYGSFQTDDPTALFGDRTGGSAYGEVGGSAGFRFSPGAGLFPYLGVEAAYGSTFNSEGIDMDDPDHADWFRAGVTVGLEL